TPNHVIMHACAHHGIHLPEGFMTVKEAHRLHRLRKIVVGRSVHSVASAIDAEAEGADYLIAGTIYHSQSHPNVEPQGCGFLEQVCNAVQIPVIAIGGIAPGNVKDCIAAGAAGVAVLSPIMRAENPGEVARAYRDALDSAI